MMKAPASSSRYLSDSVSTASPARLLIMLYDRLVLDLNVAEQALTAGNHDEADARLRHAQEIVLELRVSLDVTAWEGAPGLAALYGFLLSELVRANVARDPARVVSCRQLVEPLRDAWREAATSLAGAGAGTGGVAA